MKILCHKKTDESLHVFSNDTEIYILNGSLWFKYKYKEDYEIKGFDEENYIIYENVNVPRYWLNKSYTYNPKYGWRLFEGYTYGKENYERCLKTFLKTCFMLKEKNIITDNEYYNFVDFKIIEPYLYHPISHYM